MERQFQKMQEEIVSLRRDIGILDGRWKEQERQKQKLLQVNTPDEDKALIVQKLENLLQWTRAGSGIKNLMLDEEEEYVTIVFEGGTKRVSVTGDSGIAMIRDVIRHL